MSEQPVDYARYRNYDELTELLQHFTETYPGLISVSSIGTSYEGRDIWVADVTNQETGSSHDKPAAYFDANIHAGEVTGSAVALYLIGYLLENHGSDDFVTHLLDTRALYIVPRISVDGAEVVLTSPQTLRSSTRLRPRIEEESGIWPEDVDGNGHILNMRVKSPSGEWKISEHDERLMIPRQPRDMQGVYYHLFTEGRVVNHRSGPVNLAESKWPLDFNRNFPGNWAGDQVNSGTSPLSEPETQAMARFLAEHRNISTAVAYHTAAGIIMRSPCMGYDRDMNPKDLALIDELTKRGTELTGYPGISAYLGWSADFPMPARGNFTHWTYAHKGMIGYTIELWDMASAVGIEINKNYGSWWSDISEEDMLKILQWNDRELDGEGFSDWQPFDHPELGQIEIGGWITKWTRQNPPVKYLPEIMHDNAMFALELTAATPRIVLSDLKIEELGPRLRRIYVEVANEGFLPTYATEQARSIKVADEVDVRLTGSQIRFKAGDSRQVLGHLEGYGPGRQGWGYLFAGRANESRAAAEWVVAKPSEDQTVVQLTVRGGRAGVARRELVL